MVQQHQKYLGRTQQEEDELPPIRPTHTDDQTGHTDELLDSIDDVLEANAEQFVAAFQQQGGQ